MNSKRHRHPADAGSLPTGVDFDCQNPPPQPYSLTELVALLTDQKNPNFGTLFKRTLRLANSPHGTAGRKKARNCIRNWYRPTNDEMFAAAMDPCQYGNKKNCTDAALLLAIALKGVSD